MISSHFMLSGAADCSTRTPRRYKNRYGLYIRYTLIIFTQKYISCSSCYLVQAVVQYTYIVVCCAISFQCFHQRLASAPTSTQQLFSSIYMIILLYIILFLIVIVIIISVRIFEENIQQLIVLVLFFEYSFIFFDLGH